jgi:predicted transcriptional regulator
MIHSIHSTLSGLKNGAGPHNTDAKALMSAKRSITGKALTCVECGKRFKTLRRHLRTSHGLSPEEYRTKYRLPGDYPIVAPDYAAHRSNLARKMGLGQATGRNKRTARPKK